MMADIAAIFHWPPSVMDQMDLVELAAWWAKAHDRAGQQKDTDV